MQVNDKTKTETVVIDQIYTTEHNINAHQVIKSRMSRFCIWLVSILLLIIAGMGTWGWLWYQYQFNTAPKFGSLILQVQTVDTVGKSLPAVRGTFFLLSKDLETIASDYLHSLETSTDFDTLPIPETTETPSPTTQKTIPRWVTMLTSSTALRSLMFDLSSRSKRINVWEFRQNFNKSKPLWAPYVITTAITNKIGKAKLQSIPIGEYWLIGWIETPTGLGFWQSQVIIDSNTDVDNKLLLNSSNALYFS